MNWAGFCSVCMSREGIKRAAVIIVVYFGSIISLIELWGINSVMMMMVIGKYCDPLNGDLIGKLFHSCTESRFLLFTSKHISLRWGSAAAKNRYVEEEGKSIKILVFGWTI